MSDVNYSDTVVIPVLHGKLKEYQVGYLNLELSLLIEQAKNRDLQTKIQELEAKIQSLSKRKKKDDSKDEQILDGQSY